MQKNKIFSSKFIFWNLIALIIVKTVFSFSSLQFASIIDSISPFSKEDIVSQTNTFRSGFGFTTLQASPTLESAAWLKLQDMINNQYFAHNSPSGTTPWHWFETSKYKYTYAGENLAIGFVDAKSAVEAWANSPSHRANLLNPNYREIGVAVAPANINNNNGYLVVQLFGTPRPAPLIASKPTPTPKPVLSPTTIPKPAVESVATVATAPVTIANDITGLKTVVKDSTKLEMVPSPKLQSVAKSLNFVFIFYALGAFLVIAAITILRGIQKQLVVKTAASLALLILAVLLPVLEITRRALII